MTHTRENLSTKDFQRLRHLIYEQSGINLNPDKLTMVQIRIKRRQRALNLTYPSDYCDYLFRDDRDGKEIVHLIDAVTTNKTDFFREADHFQFMTSKALPDLASHLGDARKSLVWSAGCSTGEEPYTLAMVLAEYAQTHPGFQYEILASDICTDVLEKARQAIYRAELAAPVPSQMRKKYFMKSRDPNSDLLRIVPELRAQVEFRRVNFMDPDLGVPESPEMIFCRNVIIYFDRATQIRVLGKLVQRLIPGGYFFSGHSESLQGMDLPLVQAGPSVYRKTA
jgi:chemotaxis protein methyltransferase CheR